MCVCICCTCMCELCWKIDFWNCIILMDILTVQWGQQKCVFFPSGFQLFLKLYKKVYNVLRLGLYSFANAWYDLYFTKCSCRTWSALCICLCFTDIADFQHLLAQLMSLKPDCSILLKNGLCSKQRTSISSKVCTATSKPFSYMVFFAILGQGWWVRQVTFLLEWHDKHITFSTCSLNPSSWTQALQQFSCY